MLPETTINVILSSLMGFLGGLFTIPMNLGFSWIFKKKELSYQHRLKLVEIKRELLLKHELEKSEKNYDDELANLKKEIRQLKQRMKNG